MKIGLLGGVFNPPHLGHLLIAQQVLDFNDLDEVWFLPNYGQSFSKEVISPQQRLTMTKFLTLPRTRVSTLEIDHKLDGKTIHLLPVLPPDHQYSFIIGSDQLPVFPKWANWRELLTKIPFLVFPRYGYPTGPLYPNMRLITHPQLMATDISSTKIRERVKLRLTIKPFVPPEVELYIRQQGLYK